MTKMRKPFLFPFCLLGFLTFSSAPAAAQEEDHPTVVLSSYYDFRLVLQDVLTEGYGFTAEYLLRSDWGIALEYSKMMIRLRADQDRSLGFKGTITSPSVFLCLHATYYDRVGVIAAFGIGTSKVQYSSEETRFFVFKDEKTYVYPQVKLGLRVKIVDPVHVFANVSWYHLASAGVAVAF